MSEPCGCGTYPVMGERGWATAWRSCTDPAHVAAAAAGGEMKKALEAVGCHGRHICKMMRGNPYHEGDCVVCAALRVATPQETA